MRIKIYHLSLTKKGWMLNGLHNDQEGCNSSFYTMENPTANMKF